MATKILILLVLVASQGLYAMDIYSLFTTKRPYREGDIITVMISERAVARNSAKTSTRVAGNQEMDVAGGTGLLDFLPSFGVGASQNADYSGTGQTSKAGELDGVISVRVARVLDNGNLLIEGTKQVEINDNREILSISGVIRPTDIMPGNTIPSSKVSDARISYSGDGVNSSAQKPGVIARFFNWLF